MTTRYPDEIEMIENDLNQEFTKKILVETKRIFTWLEKTIDELKQLTDYVVSKVTSVFKVDEIVLFGSYAKGEATDVSDVDVAIISPDLKEGQAMFKHVLNITKQSGLCEPYLQLVAFPSRTYYDEESYVDPDFIREIKKTGKSLYKA